MPRVFGRKTARSSGSPPFTWEPEGRHRSGRLAGFLALSLALGGLAYGAAEVAEYLRTPADRAAAVAPTALEPEATAANGLASGGAGRPHEPQPARSTPNERDGSSKESSTALDAGTPAPAAAAPAADEPSSTVAVLNAGTAEPEAEAETRPGAQAKAPAERAARSVHRNPMAATRARKQRDEQRLAGRQRQAREVGEARLQWRFAPALRADAGTLRREDGRGPLPFAPRYYGNGEIP